MYVHIARNDAHTNTMKVFTHALAHQRALNNIQDTIYTRTADQTTQSTYSYHDNTHLRLVFFDISMMWPSSMKLVLVVMRMVMIVQYQIGSSR